MYTHNLVSMWLENSISIPKCDTPFAWQDHDTTSIYGSNLQKKEEQNTNLPWLLTTDEFCVMGKWPKDRLETLLLRSFGLRRRPRVRLVRRSIRTITTRRSIPWIPIPWILRSLHFVAARQLSWFNSPLRWWVVGRCLLHALCIISSVPRSTHVSRSDAQGCNWLMVVADSDM